MVLSDSERALLESARRGVLATIAEDGTPRLVPLVFAADTDADPLIVYSPLDDKPKAVADPRHLARVRDILRDERVTLLIDRWSEDWSQLEWLRLSGSARLISSDDAPAQHAAAVALLRARYPQYAARPLETWPLLSIEIVATRSWSAA